MPQSYRMQTIIFVRAAEQVAGGWYEELTSRVIMYAVREVKRVVGCGILSTRVNRMDPYPAFVGCFAVP